MEIDVDGNLRSMFWADSRAREAYLTFSDVIVFDVTYKTNRKHKADSEKEWGALVEKYNLDDRHWLCKMWDLRMHWVPAYFRDTFTAGMTSSARSESINAFFDGFVKQSTTLEEFVVQYEKALVARRKKEAEEDWRTKSSHAVLKTKSTLEADAAKCYTRKKFDLFQLQFLASIDCWEDKESENGNVTEYKVRMHNEEEWKSYKVIYDVSEGVNATCECAMFETAGILCRHILRIMDMRRLGSIPERYLLNRWTIGARYQVNSFASTCIGDSDEVAECEQAKKDKDSVLESNGSQVQSNYPLKIRIHDPQVVRTKGRPKNATRFKSLVEASQSQPKQQRTCKKCGEKGHYATTCKNIPEEEVSNMGVTSILVGNGVNLGALRLGLLLCKAEFADGRNQEVYDKETALEKIRSLNGFDDGNSLSNLLWWVHSRGDGDEEGHGGGRLCLFAFLFMGYGYLGDLNKAVKVFGEQ
ncbi:protein FAR1-RELATED SEQUENCE 1-like [Tasmannia lanceolata]|uniref:protein FAR1-RELATED SEQUENCE 1-like n=1 Tax=Tasmannia lanceolata TaxID=3420 RepID=UPI0040629C30